jgi:Uma2 family endonuclease
MTLLAYVTQGAVLNCVRMSTTVSSEHKVTHRDLEHTPDDGSRWEVIDGIFHVTPFPSYAHQCAVTELLTMLHAHVRAHSLGRVFAAGLKVVLDEPTGVGPDIVYVSTARMGGMREDGYHGAPDLVVEVLSSKPTLDRSIKFQKYAQAGISHYWIVDPDKRTLSAYALEADRYRGAVELAENARFDPELFEGLSIPLAELWVTT